MHRAYSTTSVFILLILIFTDSSEAKTNNVLNNVFKVNRFPIQFAFPSDWKMVNKDNPFDLQLTNNNAYFSVFAFEKIDLAEGQTPQSIFNRQNDDLLGKRTNTKLVSTQSTMSGNITRNSKLYFGEKDGSKNYYYFSLIQFNDNPDVFMWVLISAIPSYAKREIVNWNNILSSATLISE
jgi:hypothetical protein